MDSYQSKEEEIKTETAILVNHTRRELKL